MKSYLNRLSSILILIITVAVAWPLQAGEKKKVITMDDYGLWRTVSSAQLSSDGKWMTYDYSKPEADEDAPDERNLQIKHLVSDKVYEVPFGISPAFSDDSAWVAYKVDLDRKEAKKLKDSKKPIPQKVQLLNLETGEKITWGNATSFAFFWIGTYNNWLAFIFWMLPLFNSSEEMVHVNVEYYAYRSSPAFLFLS